MKNLKSLLVLCALAISTLGGCTMQLAEPDDSSVAPPTTSVAGSSSVGGSAAGGGTSVAGSSATGGGGNLQVDCKAKFPGGLASPVRTESGSRISFAAQYLPAGSNAYVVGSLPGTTWNYGVQMSKSGDRFYYDITRSANFVPGIYAAQYVSNTALVGNTIPTQYFSPFGTVQDQVACYSAEDKEFIWCNIKDGAINGCEFRFYIDGSSITGAGNLPLNPAGKLF